MNLCGAQVRSLVAGRTSKEPFESSDLEWEHAYEKRLQDERLKKLIEQKVSTSRKSRYLKKSRQESGKNSLFA